MNSGTTRGLSGGALKLFALAAMLVDHIGYIFSPWHMPIWLRYIGRLSAPIFLFLFIEGFCHTHDRRRHFLRIYIIATGMELAKAIVPLFFLRKDGFFPGNGIFSTFAVLCLMFSGLELLRAGEKKGIALLIAPLAVAPLFALLGAVLPKSFALPLQILRCFLPDASLCEGGYAWVELGLLLYILRKRRTVALCLMAGWFLLGGGIDAVSFAMQRTAVVPFWSTVKSVAFYIDYQWMAAFSAIPLAFYNGERGNAPKRLFYFFYPAHIYILYAISCLLAMTAQNI